MSKNGMEILEIVNENGKIRGSAPRSEVHGDNSLLHRVVHVLVFTNDGSLLLQKRSMNKDVAAGKWDTSVGGHVDFGESIEQAVLREMEEELGISSVLPRFVYKYVHSNPFESELVYTHTCIYEGDIIHNENEIDDVRFWEMDEIKEHLGKGMLSDNFEDEFRRYQEHSTTDF